MSECFTPRICCACGMLIGVPDDKWSKLFSLPVAAMQWCNSYRAILRKPGPLYKITGVGIASKGDNAHQFYELPIDPQVNVHEYPQLRNKKKKRRRRRRSNNRRATRLSQPRMIKLDCDCQLTYQCGRYAGIRRLPHCLLIHSCCWDWIEDVFIGPVAQQHLDTLLCSMKQLWEENHPLPPYGLHPYLGYQGDGYFGWAGDMVTQTPTRTRRATYGGLDPTIPKEHKIIVTPLKDPLHIPELLALITKSKNRRRQRQQQQHTAWANSACAVAAGAAPIQRLPIDIKELVLDEFSSGACMLDASNAVDALDWNLPDSCWKRRIPVDLALELGQIIQSTSADDDGLDWQCVFIEFWRLASNSPALLNRKRIFNVLRAIRGLFFERLDGKKDKDEKEELICGLSEDRCSKLKQEFLEFSFEDHEHTFLPVKSEIIEP